MTYEELAASARYRGLENSLTREQHVKLKAGRCSYCGGDSHGGIDRVDSRLGYSIDNCVPACMRCNARKSIFERLGPEAAVAKAIELAHRNKIPPPSKREWAAGMSLYRRRLLR